MDFVSHPYHLKKYHYLCVRVRVWEGGGREGVSVRGFRGSSLLMHINPNELVANI